MEEGGSHETNGFKNWISSEPQCCVGCLLTIYAPGGSQEKPCSLGKSHGSRLRLWQIQHRYASVHGTGKIPGRYRLPGARAGTVTLELELGRWGEFSGRASLQYCAPFQGWTGWSFAWGKEDWAFTTHQSFWKPITWFFSAWLNHMVWPKETAEKWRWPLEMPEQMSLRL